MDLTLKYRPKSFAEVTGQETVVSILSRQIATKTWKNTYLFCGVFGTGKTTCARILANEINGGQGEPIEIDGASNNGVDDIRKLIVDAQQSSIDSDYKVYIIDECHMITTQGWNAALKLIEEPPLNAIFIFCTTNPEKLPSTILSRVQRFDFKRVSRDDIADRLEFIMNEEIHSKASRDALEMIASKSDGHMRDAIRYLDKCLGVSTDITVDLVQATLGLVKYDVVARMVNKSACGDIKGSLEELNTIHEYNSDMLSVYDSTTSFIIDCAIYGYTKDIGYTSIPSSYKDEIKVEYKEKFKKFAERFVNIRRDATQANAELLLKMILVEMSEG